MEFYNRREELRLLEQVREASLRQPRITFVMGRRRIGKTRLVLNAFQKKRAIYLFVARKNETLLCNEFTDEIEHALGKKVLGTFRSFSALFEYLLDRSIDEPFTLIIDEFQEFYQVNPSVYSDMQKLWDQYKTRPERKGCRMNLVLCGSVYTMMKKIFEDAREPLFGRANEKIHLKPFPVDTLKMIYQTYAQTFSPDNFLSFYILTGGVPKYVELFADKHCVTFDDMLDEIFRPNSLWLEEGKNLLIEEFGKDYQTYFSILSLIASSKTSRADMESILEKDIGGYLERLDKVYNIIRSIRPVFAKPGGRIMKYFIEDNFLAFWFRFIYKYRTAVELNNLGYIKQLVKRDFETYSGPFLEKYFREKLSLSENYNIIGRYWDRKNENELDIVAVNEMENRALIAEVKRNRNKIKLKNLKEKAGALLRKLPTYNIDYRGFSMEDV